MTLEEIIKRLKHRRVGVVAELTGLSSPTIINIRDGKQKNPSYDTVEKLKKYFEEND